MDDFNAYICRDTPTHTHQRKKDLSNLTKVQLGKPMYLLIFLTYKNVDYSEADAAPKFSIPSIGDNSQ